MINQNKLRQHFSEMTGTTGKKNVKNILMVGAKTEPELPELFSMCDMAMLSSSFFALRSMGYGIDKDFTAQMCNISPNFGGLDFLDPKNKFDADLVVTCYVDQTTLDVAKLKQVSIAMGLDGLNFSDFELTQPNAWDNAAVRSGADTVITFGKPRNCPSGGEVHSKHFSKSYTPHEKMNDIKHHLEKSKEIHGLTYQILCDDSPIQIMIRKPA